MKRRLIAVSVLFGLSLSVVAQVAGPRWTYSPADLGGTIQESIESLETKDSAVQTQLSGALTTSNLADSAVTSAKISDGNVSNSDLAASSVTSAKIADGNVSNADLAANSVTSAKMADGNVSNADIAADAVTSSKIASGAVSNTEYALYSIGESNVVVKGSGLNLMRYAMATWSFAANGGATNSDTGGGSLSCIIPSGAVIWDGYVDVTTAITPTNSIFSFGLNGTNRDILEMTSSFQVARHAILPLGTAATSLKATNNLNVRYYITTEPATAGAATVYIRYF